MPVSPFPEEQTEWVDKLIETNTEKKTWIENKHETHPGLQRVYTY